ncbi:MAG: N-formylglutamate deformylase [Rhodobacter sp.]|nr:N-formylglutamate deformylase [Rhodobacter sp.]
MNAVELSKGDLPLVLGFPHAGTYIPEPILVRLNETGRALADTDWHIHRLYAGLIPAASVVRATFHRYVIDANRDPTGASLYPGQATTGLVPLTDFDGVPIWGAPPDDKDVQERLTKFHAPYHEALNAELARVRARHGVALLFDCHSIRSRIPNLFDGTLPDLNLGTYDGASCGDRFQEVAWNLTSSAPFSSVMNGRFKGGWTTRHYGRPDANVHAIQMEIAQSTYLTDEAPPWTCNERKSVRLRRWLKELLDALIETAKEAQP